MVQIQHTRECIMLYVHINLRVDSVTAESIPHGPLAKSVRVESLDSREPRDT